MGAVKSKRHKLEPEGSFREPGGAEQENDDGCAGSETRGPGLAVGPQDDWPERAHDGELSGFDTAVEGEKRPGQSAGGQPQFAQDVGESEAMNKTEAEGEQPTMGWIARPQILRRD